MISFSIKTNNLFTSPPFLPWNLIRICYSYIWEVNSGQFNLLQDLFRSAEVELMFPLEMLNFRMQKGKMPEYLSMWISMWILCGSYVLKKPLNPSSPLSMNGNYNDFRLPTFSTIFALRATNNYHHGKQ